MKKKGFLLAEETLKMIIALVCIVFLVYLLIALYNSHTADKKIEEARATLSSIESIINTLNDGQTLKQDILDPEGWHLYSFPGQEKPNSCLNSRCLCICERSLIEVIKSQSSKCDKKGACLVINSLADSEVDLKITGKNDVLFIDITKQSNRVFIGESK
ncbi:MAG: hypothetical protein ACP5NZ_03860 [Nanobdellota archaeon]